MSDQGTVDRDTAAAAALVTPGSIAIVGASKRSRWASALIDNLDRHGYPGDLHLVNPRGGTLAGRRLAATCTEVGAGIDLGIVVVPAAAVPDAVHDLAAAGARSAMILTSGFAEADAEGVIRQQHLLDLAAETGVRLLGPNSLGFMNFTAATVGWATPIAAPSRAEGVALVSQSGATAFFLAGMAHQQGIGLSHVVSTGNEADLDAATFAAHLATRPDVRAVAMFCESVRDPARFIAAARAAAEHGKPLVVLKVGAGHAAARSALAHTGALAGDDRVFDGICAQYDIVRVHSLEELLVTADLIARTGVLRPGGLAVVSNSGGICEVAADTAESLGIDLPEIPAATAEQLRALMPDYATAHNPLDLTGGIVPADCERIVAALAACPRYAAVLVPFYPVPTSPAVDDERLAALHRHLATALRSTPTPGWLVSYTPAQVTDTSRELIDEAGIPYLAGGMDRALTGLAHAFRWSARRRRAMTAPTRAGPRAPADRIAARPRCEPDLLDLFARHGVPVIPHTLATTAADAIATAAGHDGPVALKIVSPQIGHKTEIGGVALDLRGEHDVAAAFDRLMAAGHARPGATIDGVLVTPMRTSGLELFVGCSRDPLWGPVITVGLGGVWVEVLSDVAIRALPAETDEVIDLLNGLRGAALLRGTRGGPPVDLDAVAAAVVAIGDLAVGLGDDLIALDVNPLWVRGRAVEALDGLAVWREDQR